MSREEMANCLLARLNGTRSMPSEAVIIVVDWVR
jgi:hypothetical protein